MLSKFIIFLLIVFIPIAAFSDPAVDEPYEKGVEAFLKGDFSNAIFHFKDAYEADKANGGEEDPLIPLNLSICYEKIGNFSKALKFATEAQSGGLGDAADKNASRIVVFERILTARTAAEKIERVNKNEILCRSNDQCEVGLVCGDKGACIVDSNIEYEESRFGTVGYIGTGVSLVGVGMMAFAILSFDARVGELEELKRVENSSLTPKELQEIDVEIEEKRSTGLIVFFAGAGTAAVGLGLLIYDLATVEKAPIAMVPVVTPNRVGANFSFDF